MLEWLIVGGGVHGTYVSHYLTSRGGIPRDAVRVLDPHPQPLWRWNASTSATGMDVPGSPLQHHVAVVPSSLQRFAERAEVARPPPRRRSLALFRQHTATVIAHHDLAVLRTRGAALGLAS